MALRIKVTKRFARKIPNCDKSMDRLHKAFAWSYGQLLLLLRIPLRPLTLALSLARLLLLLQMLLLLRC